MNDNPSPSVDRAISCALALGVVCAIVVIAAVILLVAWT